VEDLLFERGIGICHETVRMWWNGFGPTFAGDIRRQRVLRMRGFRHWRQHLDEMYVKLDGEMVNLWRAVDHEGEILESYITKTRDKKAAMTFMKKSLKRHGSPEVMTTDGLRSYRRDEGFWQQGEAGGGSLGQQPRRELTPAVPTTSTGNAPLQADEDASRVRLGSRQHQNHFSLERHLLNRRTYKQRRAAALAEWQILASEAVSPCRPVCSRCREMRRSLVLASRPVLTLSADADSSLFDDTAARADSSYPKTAPKSC
jgi:putative transposase